MLEIKSKAQHHRQLAMGSTEMSLRLKSLLVVADGLWLSSQFTWAGLATPVSAAARPIQVVEGQE